MFPMDLNQIPLFAMLRGRMGYLNERQQVISENVANADTPGFLPRDLRPFSFQAQLEAQKTAMAPVTTDPAHMQPQHAQADAASGFKPFVSRDSETTLDGNAVVLEEQMMKLTDARMNYDAAVSFYQKSLALLRTAAKAPGK
jgi:flagellar basal-body rod protein FlgB